MSPKRPVPPDECARCGEAIPRGALACPACGADERTGWDANPWLPDESELPEPYDEWANAERPPLFDHEVWTRKRWVLAALIVIAAFVYRLFQRGLIF